MGVSTQNAVNAWQRSEECDATAKCRKNWLPALLLAGCAACGFAWVAYLRSTQPADFEAFYYAAAKLKAGQGATLYLYNTYPDGFGFVRPAWQALMFYPLAFLPYRAAFLAWFFINVSLLGISLWLLRDEIQALSPNRRLLLTLLLAMPVSTTLTLGQDTPVFVLLIILAYLALKEQQDLRGGVFLGLASFKLHLLLPVLLLFALRRKWRLLAGVAVVGGVLFAISTWVGGPDWVARCIAAQIATGHVVGLGTLRRTLRDAGLAQLALPAIVLGLGLMLWALRRAPIRVALVNMVVASVILNWHAYLYDYLTILPAWTSIDQREREGGGR